MMQNEKIHGCDCMPKRKVAILGYPAVVNRLVFDTFEDYHRPTIWDTYTKELEFKNRRFLIEIADTQGLDWPLYYPSRAQFIDGYILVYSIEDRASFDCLPKIHKMIYENDMDNLPIVLVGNKTDLEEDRVVEYEEGYKLAKKWNAIFLETSAKEDVDQTKILMQVLHAIEEFKGNIKPKRNSIVKKFASRLGKLCRGIGQLQ